MFKKKKFIIAVISVIVVLAAVGSGIAVMADEGQPTPSNPLLAKVAAILGNVSEQQLVDTIKQAREEVAVEAIETWLIKAVENEVITDVDKTAIDNWLAQKPDFADKEAMKAWLADRPEISNPRFLKRLILAPSRLRRTGFCVGAPLISGQAVLEKTAARLNIDIETLKSAFQEAGAQLRDGRIGQALNKAVTNGKITQAEADEISSWWEERPAAIDKLAPVFRFGGCKEPIQKFRPRVQYQGCR
jgi:hypothetical protein